MKEAGLSLCYYVILGLSGSEFHGQDLAEEHARETARVINEVNPDYVRFRTLGLKPGMPLYDEATEEEGTFFCMVDDDIIRQERLLIGHLDARFTGEIVSDHDTNLLMEVQGKMPDDKAKMIGIIDKYLGLSPEERAEIKLGRRWRMYRSMDDPSNPRRRHKDVRVKAKQLLESGELDDYLLELMAEMV